MTHSTTNHNITQQKYTIYAAIVIMKVNEEEAQNKIKWRGRKGKDR